MSMGFNRRIAKEFDSLLKNIDSFSDGQASVFWNEWDMRKIKVRICPKGGLYKDGEFIFLVHLNERPEVAPDVRCLTRIYHPNIDTIEDDGDLCLSLFYNWQPHFSLEDVVQGFLFLLYNPNLEDALCPIFSPDMSEEEFAANVRRSLNGEEIEGYQFPKNRIKRGRDRVMDSDDHQDQRLPCPKNSGGADIEKQLAKLTI